MDSWCRKLTSGSHHRELLSRFSRNLIRLSTMKLFMLSSMFVFVYSYKCSKKEKINKRNNNKTQAEPPNHKLKTKFELSTVPNGFCLCGNMYVCLSSKNYASFIIFIFTNFFLCSSERTNPLFFVTVHCPFLFFHFACLPLGCFIYSIHKQKEKEKESTHNQMYTLVSVHFSFALENRDKIRTCV